LQAVRAAQYEDMRTRRRAQQIRDFMYVHLTQGLQRQPMRWLGLRGEPVRSESDELKGTTDYEVDRGIQGMLADMRTDLDAFSEVEAYALMASGYLATRHQIGPGIGPFRYGEDEEAVRAAFPRHDWEFLEMIDLIEGNSEGQEDASPSREEKRLRRHLGRSDRRFYRWLPGPAAGLLKVLLLLLVLVGLGLLVGYVVSSDYLIHVALFTALLVLLVWVLAWIRGARLSPVGAAWKVILFVVSMVLMVFSWPYLLLRRVFPGWRRGKLHRYVTHPRSAADTRAWRLRLAKIRR
jgi:hypothetical protein